MTDLLAKKVVREGQRLRLRNLAESAASKKRAEEKRLHQLLFDSVVWQSSQCVAVTLSMPFELDTKPVTERAWEEGKAVVLAKVEPNRGLSFCHYDEETKLVATPPYGLLEAVDSEVVLPSKIDLVLVPGLAFDEDSQMRLGFGGGYYDRFLQGYQGESVSLVLEEQSISGKWAVDEFDQPVKHLIK